MPDAVLTCPRCRRPVNPWPLRRGDLCSPKHWGLCIRQVEDVLADHRRRQAKEKTDEQA